MIKYCLSYCKGKIRIFYGFCPICNSDAPDVYDCPLCEGYQQANGDKYPPTKKTKKAWWKEYHGVLKTRLMIKNTVKEARKNRLKKEKNVIISAKSKVILMEYLLSHESDIANNINDFGDLRGLFIDIFHIDPCDSNRS